MFINISKKLACGAAKVKSFVARHKPGKKEAKAYHVELSDHPFGHMPRAEEGFKYTPRTASTPSTVPFHVHAVNKIEDGFDEYASSPNSAEVVTKMPTFPSTSSTATSTCPFVLAPDVNSSSRVGPSVKVNKVQALGNAVLGHQNTHRVAPGKATKATEVKLSQVKAFVPVRVPIIRESKNRRSVTVTASSIDRHVSLKATIVGGGEKAFVGRGHRGIAGRSGVHKDMYDHRSRTEGTSSVDRIKGRVYKE